ncbi:MAG: peptide-methionine (R)-S-oxide reductase MsrB [Bacteroidetes bacterium]|nr:peptide-methionine (R)-S-oxide reductase MsrB [Bacteroidota bacterium]
MKTVLLFSFLLSLAASCGEKPDSLSSNDAGVSSEQPVQDGKEYFINNSGDTIYYVNKTTAEWRDALNSNEFHILREAGTEPAFSGDLLEEKRKGSFSCAACGLVLFESETKFKSGTGWPSFYTPADPTHVGEIEDTSYGMVRTEVVCNRCGGHLGHVFKDGPKPTGLRYCINAASLDFETESDQ